MHRLLCFSYVVSTLLATATTLLAQNSPPGGVVTTGSAPTTTLPGTQSTGTTTSPPATPTPAMSNVVNPTGTDVSTGLGRFNDATLDGLVRLALDNSPNLRGAVSRIQEARIRVQVAQSFLLPSVRSSVLMNTQSLSEHRPVAIPLAVDRLPRFQLTTLQLLPIDASYELDLFKRIRGGITVANLQVQAGESDYRALRLVLATDVARLYYLIRGNDAEQAVFRRNIQARDTTLAIVRERFRAGLISQIDVLRAETDYAGLQVQLRGLERARAELVNGLAQLCAQNPAQFALGPGALPTTLPVLPYATIPAELLSRRPDLLAFAQQAQAADAQVLVQQATPLPRVTLVGQGGFLSGRFGSWFVPSSATYLVGINASVPLYEGHRNRQLVTLARQQAETSRQAYEQGLQIAQREAETALDNLALLRVQLDAQNATLAVARRTEQYNRELYVRGLTTYLEVLDAQRSVLAAEQQLVQFRAQEAQYVVALLRALGGDL